MVVADNKTNSGFSQRRKESIMLHKKWIAIALVATAAISTTASASDRGINTAIGAVAGAVIGNSIGGQNAALVGGVLGAVVGNSVGGHNDRGYERRSQAYGAPVYYRQEPVRARPVYRDDYRGDGYRNYGGNRGYGDRHYERVDYNYGRGGYDGYRR